MEESSISDEDELKSKPESISEGMWQRFCNVEQKIETINKKDPLKKLKYHNKSKENTKLTENVKDEKNGYWNDLKPYINVNSHLARTSGTPKRKAPSVMELRIESALKARKYNVAMELNDQLAGRELAKTLADACDAKRFDEERKRKEEEKRKKNERKVVWRFEQKERWQTKGNM